jgi:hypothetical protein
MSGNLYQLRARYKVPVGQYFPVDGPHDTHGYVVSHKDTNEHGTLHLVRGTGNNADGRISPRR